MSKGSPHSEVSLWRARDVTVNPDSRGIFQNSDSRGYFANVFLRTTAQFVLAGSLLHLLALSSGSWEIQVRPTNFQLWTSSLGNISGMVHKWQLLVYIDRVCNTWRVVFGSALSSPPQPRAVPLLSPCLRCWGEFGARAAVDCWLSLCLSCVLALE